VNPSDLRRRLEQFDHGATARPEPRVDRLDDGLEALLARGAQWVGRSPTGYLRLEMELSEDQLPGSPPELVPPEAWYRLTGRHLAPPLPWAILDTETTGLESGVGTIVFLVGVVYWHDDSARLVQYFLPEPAAENAMLVDVVTDVSTAGALVSYNGKSFDVPRLASRLGLHRVQSAALEKPHLDLLHPARRVTRGWLEDCRLASVETALLGRPRHDDLPGWEVPDVYRWFLTDGVDQGIGKVLDHNRQDVVSLLELTGLLAQTYLEPRWTVRLPRPARLAVGRALEQRGRWEAAAVCYELADGDDDALSRRAAWRLAQVHRRRGDLAACGRQLETLVARWPHWIEARVELAKHLEHRVRDYVRAREMVEAALGLLPWEELARPQTVHEARESLAHRLSRLNRKAARHRTPRPSNAGPDPEPDATAARRVDPR
jgi:hypothetical protein